MIKEISAGGVVYRREGEEIEILLIQDRFGRWTLPKGKQELGETLEQTALREVNEETQVEGVIEQPIATTSYQFDDSQKGRVQKEVHYYLMSPLSDKIQPQLAEIKQVAWFSAEEAIEQIKKHGYRNNDLIIRQAFTLLGITLS